jgi:hypothetical protein
MRSPVAKESASRSKPIEPEVPMVAVILGFMPALDRRLSIATNSGTAARSFQTPPPCQRSLTCEISETHPALLASASYYSTRTKMLRSSRFAYGRLVTSLMRHCTRPTANACPMETSHSARCHMPKTKMNSPADHQIRIVKAGQSPL